MPLSPTRRNFLLLCLLAAGAFIATVALLHGAGSGSSSAGVTLTDPAVRGMPQSLAGTAPSAKAGDAHGTNAWPNPAAQKAGPPDPVAQRNAAAAAENAAQAAANLSGSGASPTN